MTRPFFSILLTEKKYLKVCKILNQKFDFFYDSFVNLYIFTEIQKNILI